MAMIEIVLTREEIQKKIPYQFICQTRYGSVWNRLYRKFLWNDFFNEEEKEKAEKMFRQTHTWYTKGIPDTVRMDFSVYSLWDKVENFCWAVS